MPIQTQVERNGRICRGSYTTDGDKVVVNYENRSMSRPTNGEPATLAARDTLNQLVRLVDDLKHC